MAFAAATDAAPSSKSPNTVAPEPDMRARRQPVAARIERQRLADRRRERDRSGLEIVAARRR